MNAFRQVIRIIHINFILAKNGLDEIILAIPLFAPIRFLAYANPWNWSRGTMKTRGERIRNALEQLGPIFVKFGQTLSLRNDLLPEDITSELAKLQDQVPPFPGEIAKTIIQNEFGCKISDVFDEFEIVPLASASIAQVHAAKFIDGKDVIIKVVRPKIEKVIRRDVALLYTIAALAERYWAPATRIHPRAIVAEFERTLLDELDLLREAGNASQLRRNFLHSNLLYIPEIFWEFTRTNVIVMERIYGIPVSDVASLKKFGVNLQILAHRGVEIFFTQVFRDSFFHADMHPGNIFINPQKPDDPQYIAVDFGIVGTLSPVDQRYLAENLIAFFNRDYHRVALLHIESGWIPANTRLDEFESAMRTVCEPIFEKPLKDISFGHILLRLIQTGQRFSMEVQPQLILLQKTLINIEGLGRQLDPNLDLWSTAKPLLEKWLKTQLGPRQLLKNIRERIPYYAEKLPELPALLYKTLETIKNSPVLNSTALVESAKASEKKTGRDFYLGAGGSLVVSALIYFILSQHNLFSPERIPSLTALVILLGFIIIMIGLLKK